MHRTTQNFLKEVVAKKRLDLAQKNQIIRKSELSSIQSFLKLFTGDDKRIKLIAEIKFASPSNPHLGTPEELLERAKEYEQAGADAISVITEKHYFKGDVSFISEIKKHFSLPILQKDFVIDPHQIYEARQIGADALLLIARLVSANKLKQFIQLCFAQGIEPVVEIANEEDLSKAVVTKTKIIAVNARDLETLDVDVAGACLLIKKIPDRFIKLAFSGIQSEKEVLLYRESGAQGILVGTSLMQTNDIRGFIRSLPL